MRTTTKYYVVSFIMLLTSSYMIYLSISKQPENQMDLKKSYQSQINWFLNNQNMEYNFPYEITTSTQKVATQAESLPGAATVRQLLSLHALSLANRENRDEAVKETVEKGINFYAKFLTREETVYNDQKIFTQRIYIDSSDDFNNSTSFFLLTLLEYTSNHPEKNNDYKQTITELGNYLLTTQLPSGGFKYSPSDPSENTYNNGETFFALARLSNISKDETYISASEKSAKYFMEKYSDFNPQFYPWGMLGFRELINLDQDNKYWFFMKDQTDQFFVGRGRLISNYFSKKTPPAPTFDIVSYMEGVLQVAKIADDKKEFVYSDKLKKLALDSLNYIVDYQINGPTLKYISDSHLLDGSMCTSQTCDRTRVDMTGHTLSAFHYYLELVD